jgi:2-dehydro-3-deoxyphosphogalactonate aldolase
LPNDIAVFAVGGVGADNFKHWLAAGARGFGIGSALYRPGDSAETVGIRAREMVATLRAINPSSPA